MKVGTSLCGSIVISSFLLGPLFLSEQTDQIAPTFAQYLSQKEHRPLVIAHRGDSQYYPENTLPAFVSAVNGGADMIELDVFLVKNAHNEPKLVVIHDPTLDRTTNGTGIVWNYSLEALKQFDAGSWFSSMFQDVVIPTLEEVFQAVGGKVLINVEIKYEQGGRIQGYPIEQEVIKLIEKYHLTSSVMISSFNYETLRAVRNLNKEIYIGVLSEEPEDNLDVVALCKAVHAVSYHPDGKYTTRALIDSLHAENILVIPWVYKQENTEETITRMLAMGADGFFANDPARMRKIVLQRVTHAFGNLHAISDPLMIKELAIVERIGSNV